MDKAVQSLSSKRWGDYTTERSASNKELGEMQMVDALEEFDSIEEVVPILMLPPPSLSEWVIRKVVEVKRRMSYSFKEMEQKIEEFFWEVEQRRSWSPRRPKEIHRRHFGNGFSRELKNLHSDINYEGRKEGKKGTISIFY